VSRAFPQVRDSKKLSPKQREVWFGEIRRLQRDGALSYTSVFISARSIDARGMAYALKIGIARVLSKISVTPNVRVLLDGGIHAPKEFLDQITIIKGDETELPIALASIVAKVRRDAHMVRASRRYPAYEFETHKGYGTLRHRRIIRRVGLSPIHRTTFCTNVV
jgi:ribonuclease HII